MIDALKVNPGETGDELLRIAMDLPESRFKTSVEFITSDFPNPLSSKSKTLDGPTVRVLEEIVKAVRKIVRGFGKLFKCLGKTLEH